MTTPPAGGSGHEDPQDVPQAGPGQNEPGRYVKDCYFKNIRLAGKAGGRPGIIYVSGADAQHCVENVTFQNVYRFGEPVGADSPDVTVGANAKNVKFLVTK